MSNQRTARKLSKQAQESLFFDVLEANNPLSSAEVDAFNKIDVRRARALAEQPTDEAIDARLAEAAEFAGGTTVPRIGTHAQPREHGCQSAVPVPVTCETAVASVLEPEQKTVEQAERPGSHLLKRTRCRCRFCNVCCVSEGLKTRDKLLPVLRTFKGITMITFTIDPTLCEPARQWFLVNLGNVNKRRNKNNQQPYTQEQIQSWCGQEVIYRYIQERRSIGELVRSLFKAGLLASRRYVCAVEYQMGKGRNSGTLMPHYHLVVEATTFGKEAEAYTNERWSDFRPPAAGPVLHGRPGFGFIKPTESAIVDEQACERAAGYVLKYIGKAPEKGWPVWVLNSHGEVKRIWTSKGFYPKQKSASAEPTGDEQPACEAEAAELVQAVEQIARLETTIAERVAQCGKGTVILKMPEVITVDNEQFVEGEAVKYVKGDFIDRYAHVSIETVLSFLRIDLPPGVDKVRITWQEAMRVQQAFGKQKVPERENQAFGKQKVPERENRVTRNMVGPPQQRPQLSRTVAELSKEAREKAKKERAALRKSRKEGRAA